MRLYYSLTNLEPLVISQSSASTNNHQCLDHIPGSAILGALAQRLYSTLDPEQSFALFHSGACRFGPAYPLLNNELALPVPASWHREKNNSDQLSNHAAAGFERQPDKQYQQCRSGFITHQLQEATVNQLLTTRTALDEQTQKASDGQLYTYACIAPEQSFAGWVEADDPALLELIKPLLNGEFSLGRARSSEFGRVQLHCPQIQPQVATVNNLGNRLVVWCLSDMECHDQAGMPTLTPQPQDLHPELTGKLDAQGSFIRCHKVRRFNRARNGFDSEQQLITRGSVLSFDLDKPASDDTLKQLASQGAGTHRQQGLGWISVNPSWAGRATPDQQALFNAIHLEPVLQPQPAAKADTPLLLWVKDRHQQNEQQQNIQNQLQQLYGKIHSAYQNARAYRSCPPSHQAGPSSSQWRRLAELVRSQNQGNWHQLAFDGDAAICKAKNDEFGWGIDWHQHGRHTTFAGLMKEEFKGLDTNTMRRLLENLCRYDLSTSEGLKQFKQRHITGKEGAQTS